ncbi:MAG TPA: HD-GYP domain-containing protein [Actinomycetota bacterium]
MALGRAVPAPAGALVVLWWLGIFAVCSVTAVLVERLARRLLPLATLLQLSLVFPDRAPSRFVLARRSGNVRRLEERVRAAHEQGVSDDPARAAEEILSLVAALSAHDRKTRGHSERVRAFTDLIAGELKLTQDERDRLRWAALLHDVGKLRVPAKILNKPGKPDEHEWELLKRHPAAGARIAAPLLPWLGEWGATIAQHHERYDGNGYPAAFAGEQIAFGARIVSVADSFEVMTAARSYKKPMSVPAAREELVRNAGSQFDPAVVRTFLSISIGRLWWTVGPASWVGITPFFGWLQRAAAQAAAAAQSAAVVAVVGLSGVVAPASQSASGSSHPPAPTTSGAPYSPPTYAPVPQNPHPDGAEGQGHGGHGKGQDGGGGKGGGSGGGDDPDTPPDPGGGSGGPVSDTVNTVSDTVTDTVDTVSDTVEQTVDDAVDAVDTTIGGILGG